MDSINFEKKFLQLQEENKKLQEETKTLLKKVKILEEQICDLLIQNAECNKRIKWLELPQCTIEDLELIDYYDNLVVQKTK